MKIVCRGAESVIYFSRFEQQNVLVKERIKKGYRIAELDEEIRKARTKREARLINEARRVGVAVPRIFSVDDYKIKMDFIKGQRLKELLNETDNEQRGELAKQIGKSVGIMHANDIVHGDLTTSNMILKENKVYFIDFGLGQFSKRIEDMGIDLSVLKEAISSTHFMYLNNIWKNIIKGYKESNQNFKKVFECLDKIEARGRYIRRN